MQPYTRGGRGTLLQLVFYREQQRPGADREPAGKRGEGSRQTLFPEEVGEKTQKNYIKLLHNVVKCATMISEKRAGGAKQCREPLYR